MISRFSSRRLSLETSFIRDRLEGAVSYDRIAGFFRSSLLEVAGEQLEALDGKIRVVCNSEIDQRDVSTAKAAQHALRKSWCAGEPEKLGRKSRDRFSRLFYLLVTGKLEVRILPDAVFGLIHGKAGVIGYKNGRKTCFMGSANESLTAWKLNYELVWEDDSEAAVQWVQEEFESLWNHPDAIALSEFVIKDIKRLSLREEIPVDTWREKSGNDPASGVVETPVYRKEYGLWAHQKYFIKLAFEAHKIGGARFILADQVGLGKTVQLALSAMLMVLQGDKPALVIVPKPLTLQWQDELRDLLGIPSAVWTGREWIDEQGIVYPSTGSESIKKCPRRIGIMSQGLITSGSEVADHLKLMQFECIIVDEAHRARRRKVNEQAMFERAEPNNLMRFLREISPRTKSLLLATATPVQLHPIEAWDLLDILATGNDMVFGNSMSRWRRPDQVIPVIMGETKISEELGEAWRWIRNPMPPAAESRDFKLLRRKLGLKDRDYVAAGDSLEFLRPPEITRLRNVIPEFGRGHNPFIRHIVRRTREFLEETIDPATGEPYLKPVRVKLFGEEPGEAVILPPYLQDAYQAAEEFCSLLSKRVKGAGFLKTLLLRRIGSTIYAGRQTTEKMLNEWGSQENIVNASLFEEEDDAVVNADRENMKNITDAERSALSRCLKALDASQDKDPKYKKVEEYLVGQGWLAKGCIVFSQYFDSIWWLAKQLSADLSDEIVGIYAGGVNSGTMLAGIFNKMSRDDLKFKISTGEIRLLLGTDAASEGLNLQRLGTLINLDLPWNPTRLEQRKGRIQRIGQALDEINVYNMRYMGSVEDRVHELLSSRLEDIHGLFGQIPDVLEDVWIDVANGEVEEAKKLIESVHPKHPFDEKYNRVSDIDWESCAIVLDEEDKKRVLVRGW
ncbi:helicase SNF2 [Desulfopila sp. IMCC35006]|uniref:phospholipase D-like domain-containing anti-phage protein n=1 Tax=Desulfopila sp. IMCC35006 TaxID=2569542 RepID=UPI0010AC15C4|nr:phospholipase D-like domain-containing anti-phage protein [Desulfopila sp. IMCC35006]TKB23504.1 helicase SNF2 [Desulfopila sp. IMCC35006]